MEKQRTAIPYKERINCYLQSRAASPEIAARNVLKIGMICPINMMKKDDVDLLLDQVESHLNILFDYEVDHYYTFCNMYKMHSSRAFLYLQDPPDNLCRPYMGASINNAMVMTGLLFLKNARNFNTKSDKKGIYPYMRMRLEEYLDALIDLSVRKDGTRDEEHMKRMRELRTYFLVRYDPYISFADAIQEILEKYIEGYELIQRIQNAIWAKKSLERFLEMGEELIEAEIEEEIDRAKDPYEKWFWEDMALESEMIAEDPYGYYSDLVDGYYNTYWEQVKESCFNTSEFASSLFLHEEDFRPETMRRHWDEIHVPEFDVDIESILSDEILHEAMRNINIAVGELYMLLTYAYFNIGNYHYETHFTDELNENP